MYFVARMNWLPLNHLTRQKVWFSEVQCFLTRQMFSLFFCVCDYSLRQGGGSMNGGGWGAKNELCMDSSGGKMLYDLWLRIGNTSFSIWRRRRRRRRENRIAGKAEIGYCSGELLILCGWWVRSSAYSPECFFLLSVWLWSILLIGTRGNGTFCTIYKSRMKATISPSESYWNVTCGEDMFGNNKVMHVATYLNGEIKTRGF